MDDQARNQPVEFRRYFAQYMSRLEAALQSVDLDAVESVVNVLAAARRNGRQVFTCGNGASAALASHFAADLAKMASPGSPRFRAVALTDNVPLITAWANDSGYTEVFSRQLANLLLEGDVLVAISCSGNSENVIAALEAARARGGETIGLLGFDGGSAKPLVDHVIWCGNSHYGIVEDVHYVMCHIIANFLSLQG
jgi:D-sedoheptulose 7-phosphate isomerase